MTRSRITAADSVLRAASRFTSTSAEGGSTNRWSELGNEARIWRAPSISTSSTAVHPRPMMASISFRSVPYRLPA